LPYITGPARWPFHVDQAADAGELNFVISTLIARWLQHVGLRYENLNAAIGVLECAKLELYRRIAAPYEDKKITANGDLPEFAELLKKIADA